jgi:hypothetical protein
MNADLTPSREYNKGDYVIYRGKRYIVTSVTYIYDLAENEDEGWKHNVHEDEIEGHWGAEE